MMSDLAKHISALSPEQREALLKKMQQKMVEQQVQQRKAGVVQQQIFPHRREENGLALSFAQERLWFLHQFDTQSAAYNIPNVLHFKGVFSVSTLEHIFTTVIQRHEVLRTVFHEQNEKPVQVIAPSYVMPLPVIDLSDIAAGEQEKLINQLAYQEQQQPFDLATGPLLRALVLRLSPQNHMLLFTLHHIIFDGWSTNVLVRELSQLYQAEIEGKASTLTPLPIQYADYALWQREWLQGEVLQEQLRYWQQQLAQAPAVLNLPTDRARPATQSFAGAQCNLQLSAHLTTQLKVLSQQEGVTLFMTLFAAFQMLLLRYSAQEDIVVGTPIANRTHHELENLIGFFVNTLVLRTDLSGNPSFVELLQRVRHVMLGAYAHQDLPFEKVVEALEPVRDLSRSPLFQVMFVLQNAPHEQHEVAGIQMRSMEVESTASKFDLTLTVVESERGLLCVLEYNSELFKPETMTRLLGHWQTILQRVLSNPHVSIGETSLLTEREREEILGQWNATQRDYPQELSVPQLFEQQVARTPDAVALVFEEQMLSYEELNRRANQLAHYLRQQGVGPEVLVGIYMERSLEMVVALFAILKAGGAYVPLDPDYPTERVSFMLTDAGVKIVLQCRDLHLSLPAGIEAIQIDSQWEQIATAQPGNPTSNLTAKNLAYVIYTSGSTGKPKGTMNTHQGLCNYLLWRQETYHLLAEDRVVQKTPYSFDVSIWEFFWPLTTGASLIMARPGGHQDPSYLRTLIAEQAVTTLHFVPSMLHVFLQEQDLDACRSLRQVMCSGEALSADLQASFFAHFSEQVQLHNLYGPTEASVEVTSWVCRREDESVPIGTPIANTQIYLLDSYLQPAPIGVPGELYIGGVNLARGYLKRADLTGERFIPHPFSTEPGQRLYRTGDLARYLPDGSVEYLGRLDQQVKIRGQRVELGEIETAVRALVGVEECVVLVREDQPGEKRLVAYVVGHTEDTLISSELRTFLQEQLPSYMVPAAFVLLDALPLTSNGKVDRRALPVPEQLHPELAETFIAPGTEVETILARIWSQLLRVEQVGIHDNFFALGGDSILSIQVVSRARQAGLHFTPKQLFHYQSIAQLARVVTTTSTSQSSQTLITGPVPLTPIQHWFFARQLPMPQHYNQAVMLSTANPLSLHWLQQALYQLVLHHDALRLRFQQSIDGWQQEIAGKPASFPGISIDLSGLPEQQRLSVQLALAETAQTQLDLNAGLLLKSLYFLHGSEYPANLLLIIHHLAVDGVSWRLLLEDLETAYGQLVARQSVQLPDKTSSWQTWSKQLGQYAQTTAPLAEQAYWLDAARTHVQPLPQDFPGGDNTIASNHTHQITLSREQTRALLQDVPDAYHTQINEVLLTALAQTVARWTGQSRLLIDLEGHGREEVSDEVDLSRTVGWFTTLFPVLLESSLASSPVDALKTIKEQLRQVPHKGMNYGLLRFLNPDPEMVVAFATQPQAQVVFNYLGQLDASFSSTSLFTPTSAPTGAMRSPLETRSHLLEITASVAGEHLHLNWQYSQEIHQRETIEQVAQAYVDALIALIEQCQAPEAGGYTPSDFPLVRLNQAELDKLVQQIPQAQKGRPGQAIEDIYPLSPMQTGLLFHSLYTPEAGVYGNQLEWTIQGEVNVTAWQEAWRYVIQRHPLLRTLFVWEGVKQPLQVVLRQVELSCELQDWRAYSPLEQQEHLDSLRQAIEITSQDLGTAPLLRLALIQMQDQTYTFHLNMHHLITDGWSHALLLTEVQTCYQALCQGEDVKLPAVRPYRDYLLWLQQHDLTKAEHFWRDYLRGLQTPTRLPGRIETSHPHWTQASTQQVVCSTSLTTAITSGAQQQHVTLNTLVQGAWALLLGRYSGEDEVLFGATTTGRPPELPGVETMFGVFINTLPVRVQISQRHSAGDWLRALQSQLVDAREYEYAPLIQIQTWSEIPTGQTLFESIVIFQNYPEATSVLEQSEVMTLEGSRHEEQTNFPLALLIVPHKNTLVLRVQYDEGRFEGELINRLLQQLQLILRTFVEQPEQPLEQISLLSAQERQRVLVEWNATQRDYPQELGIHQLFEQQVERAPDAVALIFEEQMLSYEELNQRANQLAHYLRQQGVGPEVLVGICLERSLEMVVGLLGILKTGGAYLPLDPTYPRERLAFMLQDAQVEIVLTHTSVQARLPQTLNAGLCIDQLAASLLQMSHDQLRWTGSLDQLAYVIYTSGSTGKPKGTMNTHQGLGNYLHWRQEEYQLSSGDRVLQKTPYSFDVSVWEFFWPLMTGASLIMARPEGHRDPAYLRALIVEQAITTVHFVPSMLHVFLQEPDLDACLSLRQIMCSGEALSTDLQASFFARFSDQVHLHNLYGPTEAAIDVTSWSCQRADAIVPIGVPIANTQIYLLDSYMQPVPIGVVGELYIGGLNLARGYLGRADLTGERFIAHPFSTEPGQRLYRTGDLARHLPDGSIEYLGRLDQQVKIRGQRIELGEIEVALRAQVGIEECVVLAREDRPGDTRLVAYIVGQSGMEMSQNELRSTLQEQLPSYMVPATFVFLDTLPLTSNGKLDRRALPAPDALPEANRNAIEEPGTPIEEVVLGIWRKVLGQERIGINDNFFELGGHSLLAIQLSYQLRDIFQVNLPLRRLFEDATTISKMAELVEEELVIKLETLSEEEALELLSSFDSNNDTNDSNDDINN